MKGEARQLVKEGRVTQCYPERHTARVLFEDKDGMTGAEMPILTMCAYGDKFYTMPDVGDVVVCLFASNSDMTGNGWIIGSRFNDKSVPNANSQDVTRLDFADKTFIEYDRKKHELRLKCKGKIIIEADDDIKISGKAKITANADEDIKITGKQKITTESKGVMRFKSEDEMFADGKNIFLNSGGE